MFAVQRRATRYIIAHIPSRVNGFFLAHYVKFNELLPDLPISREYDTKGAMLEETVS